MYKPFYKADHIKTLQGFMDRLANPISPDEKQRLELLIAIYTRLYIPKDGK